nr:restriction endonuclease subunit S [Ruminococcus sp.]
LLERIKAEKQELIRQGKIKKDKCKDIIKKEEVPFEIPDSWEWCRLGFIGDWGSGATPSRTNKEYYNGDIPWLKTGDLNNGMIVDIPEKITELALEKTSIRLNPIGSVLIAMYGATIGKLGILTIPATTNQACCACLPIIIDNKYLFYFLMANKDNFTKRAEGGAQPNISKEKIISTLFPVPPLAEQKRIVEKIEELMKYCDIL